TLPGVFVHATAINNLLRRDPLRELAPAADGAITGGLAIAAAGLTVAAPLGPAGAALALGMLAYVALAVVAFHHALVLPLLGPVAAAALAFVLVLLYRIAIADKDKRRLRQMF